MLRNRTKILGTRNYANYKPEALEECLDAMFPTLLKELMSSLAENQKGNLKSGFSKCRIYPLNKQKLLERLPENQNLDTSAVGEAFIEQLEKRRSEFLTKDGPKKRKKKLQVPAGKSVSLRELEEAEQISKQSTSTFGTIAKKSWTTLKLKKKKTKRTFCKLTDFSSDEENIEIVLESDGESQTFSDIEEILLERSGQKASVPEEKQIEEIKPEDCSVGNFVIVDYNGQKYPRKILNIYEEGPTVECMEKIKVLAMARKARLPNIRLGRCLDENSSTQDCFKAQLVPCSRIGQFRSLSRS